MLHPSVRFFECYPQLSILSPATGIDDYTGYDALEEQKRAKAQADLTLAAGSIQFYQSNDKRSIHVAGFGPIVGAYVSGERPDQVENQEKKAEGEKKETTETTTTAPPEKK